MQNNKQNEIITQQIYSNGDNLLNVPPDVVSEGIVPVKSVDFDHLVNMAEQRLEFQKRIIPIALKITNPTDWTNQSGKPWLTGSGAEKIRSLFGISVIDLKEKHEELDGQSGYLYTYSATFMFASTQIIAIGTCSSKDQFFAKTKAGYRPIEEIDQGNIKKAAYTNMMVNGITRILGMRNLTWRELQKAEIEESKVPNVEYSGGFKKTEASIDSQQKLILLRKALFILADQDKDGAAEILQNITKSDDGVHKGVRSPDHLKSDKHIGFVFNRVKEMYSKSFDWNLFITKGQAVPLALKGTK